MRYFIYSLMTDRKKGILYLPFTAILYIASVLYGIAIWIRKLLYALKIFKTSKGPLTVISVGNLTLGGTGKTPFVIFLANLFKDEIKREVCVLTKGYGWDEQAMLKKNLPDTPLLVGEDRVRLTHRAIKLYGSSAGILDDGFQYWELARDLNIILIDAGNPFGNGHLFPRGVLREPVSAAKRADIVVFTKVDKNNIYVNKVKPVLQKIKKDLIFAEAVHVPKFFYDTKARKELALTAVKGKKVLLVSSIGDNDYFENMVSGFGADIAKHIAFSDHHNYNEDDVARIATEYDRLGCEAIITTDKDIVKIHRMAFSFGARSVLVLRVEMEITKGKEELIARLHSLFSRQRFK